MVKQLKFFLTLTPNPLGHCAKQIANAIERATLKLQDPFVALGLSPGCSEAEIKTSYKKKILIYHPDKRFLVLTLTLTLNPNPKP
jgi:preprotein translocase subunit Sec63